MTNTLHYMAEDLLDLCQEAPAGSLTVTPVVAEVTCAACKKKMEG